MGYHNFRQLWLVSEVSDIIIAYIHTSCNRNHPNLVSTCTFPSRTPLPTTLRLAVLCFYGMLIPQFNLTTSAMHSCGGNVCMHIIYIILYPYNLPSQGMYIGWLSYGYDLCTHGEKNIHRYFFRSNSAKLQVASCNSTYQLGFNPSEKYATVKLDHETPIFGVKIKNIWVATT